MDPELAKITLGNLSLNVGSQAEVNLCAVCDITGHMLSFAPRREGNSSTNMIKYHNLSGIRHLNVPSMTLDDYCSNKKFEKVDVIKVDIEGAEVLAIHGMHRMLEVYSPIILMEIHPNQIREFGEQPEKIFSFFERAGYGAYTLPDHKNSRKQSFEGLVPFLESSLEKNTMFVFRKRS